MLSTTKKKNKNKKECGLTKKGLCKLGLVWQNKKQKKVGIIEKQ